MTEYDVGPKVYETWPTGATRSIELLESKLKEAVLALSKNTSTLNELIEKFKLKEFTDDIESKKEERWWKNIEIQLEYNKNVSEQLNPGTRKL